MLSLVLRGTSLPAPALETLAVNSAQFALISLAQSAQLARLAGLLQDHGIPSIALKGPLLSLYLHKDLSARSSGDIDLLVHPEDVLRVRDLLISRGYQVTNTLHWSSDSAYLRSRENEISFQDPSGSVNIDIHWRILPPYFASPFDRLDAWQSLQSVTLAGRQVNTLAPEPLLLLLCSHGAKHAFERLGWICDIASLLKVAPDLDWDAVFRQAAAAHTSRQLCLGLQLAADLLGAQLPAGMPSDAGVQKLVGDVKHRLLTGAPHPAEGPELIRFSLQVLERTGQRLRFLAGQYAPSEAEYRVLRLPPALFFLYYLFRPLRLIYNRVRRIW